MRHDIGGFAHKQRQLFRLEAGFPAVDVYVAPHFIRFAPRLDNSADARIALAAGRDLAGGIDRGDFRVFAEEIGALDGGTALPPDVKAMGFAEVQLKIVIAQEHGHVIRQDDVYMLGRFRGGIRRDGILARRDIKLGVPRHIGFALVKRVGDGKRFVIARVVFFLEGDDVFVRALAPDAEQVRIVRPQVAEQLGLQVLKILVVLPVAEQLAVVYSGECDPRLDMNRDLRRGDCLAVCVFRGHGDDGFAGDRADRDTAVAVDGRDVGIGAFKG